MNDPREKRPTSEDLRDSRHQAWIQSLKQGSRMKEDKVIDMAKYTFGKTATVLSDRELEVLQLISFGHSTDQIADKLYLSSHTVKNHRKNMLARSRCGNLTELVRVAINENLL